MDTSFTAIGTTASVAADPTKFRGSLPLAGGESFLASSAEPVAGRADQDEADGPRLHGAYARALAGQDDSAERAREGTRQLDLISAKLGEAEAKLQGIVKQYPPYAKDHPDRIDILNQITGLRKQIEALSIPAQKLSDKTQELAQSLGFAAPDPLEASDQEVVGALDQVRQAQSGVALIRASMWADVVAVVPGQSEQDAVKYARQGQEHLAQSAKSITLSQDVIASLG